MTTIGRRLRQLRGARGYDVAMLSKLSGVSENTIKAIENGHREPSWENLKRLAKLYQLTPWKLMQTVDTFELRAEGHGDVINTDRT